LDSQSKLQVTASCADNWAETKPTLPDGTRPGLAVITEGELRRQNAGAPAARPLTDYVLTTRKQRRLPPWLDLGVRGAPPFAAAESRRHAHDTMADKRGAQSCISNCMETDNMTFVRCRFLCR